MTRPTHSENGFIRSLQLSRYTFFAFVEGGIDRPFYERIVRRALDGSGHTFAIVSAKELPGNTGGKARLQNFYRKLSRRGELAMDRLGKKTVTAFFFDKDIDDVARTKLRSDHVFYTENYDLEGDLLTTGDLIDALSVSCGLTHEQTTAFFVSPQAWLKNQTLNWKEWAALCMFSHLREVAVGCNYSRCSPINPNSINSADAALLAQMKETLKNAAGLDDQAFEDALSHHLGKIAQSIAEDAPLRYFVGAWILHLLQKHVEQLSIPDITKNSVGEKVLSSLVSQIARDDTCPVFSRYKDGLIHISSEIAVH